MKTFLKKINVAITLLLITSVGYAYGDDNNSSPCEESVNCSPCEPSSCGQGFIGAELIYWRAYQSGLDSCETIEFSERENSDGKLFSNFNGRGRDPHFQWDPGFRIGAGYQFACSNWDVAAIWTHFHSHANRNENDENKVRWNINLDVIDVVAAYQWDTCNCFSLVPFAGIRGAIIDEKLHEENFRDSERGSSSSTHNRFSSKSDNKEYFWGVGPLLGLQADWNIRCGFSVYGSASVSWMYGNFDLKFKEFDESKDMVNRCNVKKNIDADIAAADFAIGIRWQRCFCINKKLILQLGLEHHRYFDFNRFGNYGDLSVDGFNIGAGIEF